MSDVLEEQIQGVLREVIGRNGTPPSLIGRELSLVGDLGLASLDLAEVIALIEVHTDLNPFADGAIIAEMRTVGALVDAYRKAQATRAA